MQLKGLKPGKLVRNKGIALGYEANIAATATLVF